jgi:hypothetical protein
VGVNYDANGNAPIGVWDAENHLDLGPDHYVGDLDLVRVRDSGYLITPLVAPPGSAQGQQAAGYG